MGSPIANRAAEGKRDSIWLISNLKSFEVAYGREDYIKVAVNLKYNILE